MGVKHLHRQIRKAHERIRLAAQDQYPLDHIAQLAHISRPGIAHKDLLHLLRQFGDRFVHPLRAVAEEIRGQLKDVLSALAQRGQLYRYHRYPEIEVPAEALFFDLFLKVEAGGADELEADLLLLRASERPYRALVYEAEELRLQREREVAYLVEKKRALVGDLDQPRLV
ncbi:hypothetical protein SDC9_170519 [bioreactor metagenome]|uniref:Uncharacterized protein n=1 Tax=bioreactor metagenome TaxID=1076179 RepID=A0A645GHB9_9ZZZZ